MTTLYPETHGEGGDTAAQGRTVPPVAFGKPRVPAPDQAGPQAEVAVAGHEVGNEESALHSEGNRETPWHGLTACYWLVYPHSVHAVSADLAAKFSAAGKVVTLGTWADAEAVRVGMEQTAVPHPAPGALPGVGVGS